MVLGGQSPPACGRLAPIVERRENHQNAIGCTGSQTPRRRQRLELDEREKWLVKHEVVNDSMDEREKWLVKKDKGYRLAATWGTTRP